MEKPMLYLLIYRVKSQGHLALAVKDIRDCGGWGPSVSSSSEPTLAPLATQAPFQPSSPLSDCFCFSRIALIFLAVWVFSSSCPSGVLLAPALVLDQILNTLLVH